jgi:hypothetical protein
MKEFRFRPLVALILMMCCTLGYAQKFEIDGLTYQVVNTSEYVEVVDVADKENIKTLKIPATVKRDGATYTVKSIGHRAIAYCKNLTSITIPNSVTNIGSQAFLWCCHLTSITLPNSVTAIGKEAFEDCRSLTSITIPNSVTIIEDEIFEDCENLKTITIPQHFNDYSFHNFYRWDVQVGAKIIWKGKTDKEPSRSIIYEGPQIDDLIEDQTAGGSVSVY